jgi:hypothetical protein
MSSPNVSSDSSIDDDLDIKTLINGKMSGFEKEKFMFILHAICMQMTHLSLPILLSKYPCSSTRSTPSTRSHCDCELRSTHCTDLLCICALAPIVVRCTRLPILLRASMARRASVHDSTPHTQSRVCISSCFYVQLRTVLIHCTNCCATPHASACWSCFNFYFRMRHLIACVTRNLLRMASRTQAW